MKTGDPLTGPSMHNNNNNNEGIGVVKFLEGKTFFITGATGFLAKVLVEKMLRSVPDIDKIYVMIKARNKQAAMDRLKTEIIDAEIFKCLKEKYGKSYENFMLSKLVPVIGNICESDLGLQGNMADEISRGVDVIINSAANTTFDERYDVSININTRGPSHLLNFAKTCKNLKLFLHVSTAYANGTRKGRIMEKLFHMGDSIAAENMISSESLSSPRIPTLNFKSEIQLALNAGQSFKDNSFMKKLGLERAKNYGWADIYTFTKAMGEMIISDMKGEVPIVIIRPSIIESTYKEPFPGWIQGNRVADPVITLFGKGQLTSFLADPHCLVDIIPADIVVNVILVAIAKHGNEKATDVNLYQVASSVVNPLTYGELCNQFFEHFKSSPLMDLYGKPIKVEAPLKLYSSMEEFTSHLEKDLDQQRQIMAMHFNNNPNKAEMFTQKLREFVKHMVTTYRPYCFYGGSNMQKLMESISEEEKLEFGFDVRSIDWKYYIKDVHIPGLRKHVLMDKSMRFHSHM